jgi:GTP pyrophosphokinase
LYPEELYTFTPLGRVVVLPRSATPIDFAYAVHTEVGHQCIGARVNGAIVPLRHTLSNGDVVEIMTQKGHEPSRDWLSFVQTSRARSKIRQWINLHEREQAKDVGRKLLEKEARAASISLKKIADADWQRVASEYGCGKIEDLHADLGYRNWSCRRNAQARLHRQEDARHQRRRDYRARPRRFDGLPLEVLQRDSGR